MNAYITRIAAFLPNEAVANDQMESVLGMTGGKPSRARALVLRSNGIRSRHYAVDPKTGAITHTNAQLAAEAVRRLKNGDKSFDVDCLACGTSAADQIMPNHASMVHGELRWPPCEVISPSGVCLSSLTALKYVYLGVKSGEFRRGVACGSETPSSFMRSAHYEPELDAQIEALEKRPEIAFEKDFLRWMLSDGAGAALVEPAPGPHGLSLRIDWIVERSYADEMAACMYAGAEKQPDGSLKGWGAFAPKQWLDRSIFAVKQDVKQLNEHIMPYTAGRGIQDVLKLHPDLHPDQLDWFLPHYSSAYFRTRAYESLKKAGFEIPEEKWFTNLATKGNMGSASIYIILDELFHSGRLKPGQRLLCYVPESGRFSTGFMHLTVVASGSETPR
jgi:3-oxoacyl-[acyl-carrier-protein] synthase-3